MSFSELGLSSWIVRQLEGAGVSRPTPIQTRCIPAILSGSHDAVLGVAHTGSGKTLAFALPILEELARDPYGIFAVILTPTRELAGQIGDQFRMVGRSIGLRDCVVVGGTDMVTQGRALANRPHVVVATPGRLADHLQSCATFSLRQVRYLVLDEADRVLDGGFDNQLRTVLAAMPKKRKTLLFTATVSDDLRWMVREASDKKPFVFDASEDQGEDKQVTVSSLDQRYVLTPFQARDGYLVHIIQKMRKRNDSECQALSMTLSELGFPNAALHSNKTTRERREALARFRSNHVRTLVATDVASRGLDVPAVDLVLNHHVPSSARGYVHRVGRTARAGRTGMAVTLVTPSDVKLVKSIECSVGVELSELEVKDEEVADILTQVTVTRREQEIKMSEADFEERREINRRKKLIKKGIDPDEEDKRLAKEKRKRQREFAKEKAKRKKMQQH